MSRAGTVVVGNVIVIRTGIGFRARLCFRALLARPARFEARPGLCTLLSRPASRRPRRAPAVDARAVNAPAAQRIERTTNTASLWSRRVVNTSPSPPRTVTSYPWPARSERPSTVSAATPLATVAQPKFAESGAAPRSRTRSLDRALPVTAAAQEAATCPRPSDAEVQLRALWPFLHSGKSWSRLSDDGMW